MDQVLAGPRAPANSNPDLTFFNFLNPFGARDNPKQGALDDFQLLRLVKSINVAAAPTTGQTIKFDPDRIFFKGHSQGSLTGALFLAAEPEVKAGVLSGPGAVIIYSLLNKTNPVDIPSVVGALFHDPVDEFHPVLSLLQNFVEESDPANYGRLLFEEPPMGFAPKNVFQALGIVDTYAPIPNNKAMALCTGLQPVEPALEPIDGLDLAGLKWGDAPMGGNVSGGRATGVLLEYKAAPFTSDGHFVIGGSPNEVPAGVHQYNRFLATLAANGTARLDPP
jgi:hypothetical protein